MQELLQHRFRLIVLTATMALLPLGSPSASAQPGVSSYQSSVGDSLYNANHPRLLLARDDIPGFKMKISKGGRDGQAFDFIEATYRDVYRFVTLDSLLDNDFGLEAIPNLGLVGTIGKHRDRTALELGKTLVLYIADNWDIDTDPYGSALRLRAMSLGYDMFFAEATPSERGSVLDEMLSYMEYMRTSLNYSIWWNRPYLSNKSMMVASSLGLASISLSGEIDPETVSITLGKANELIDIWLTHHIDPDGTGYEGALYVAWSLRNLIYYFEARLRYDGYNYGTNSKLRNMERWFAYELDPEGGGKVNNLQDCTGFDLPLARHTTYFDWAQSMWASRLSAYLWEHVAGQYGYDFGDASDKAGTILWHQGLTPRQPDDILPSSILWEQRGLYYYRSGWPVEASSDEVVFSFYSGKFQGGHAQEDQNQFTLAGYGEKFVIDHGVGVGKESQAHNMVFIDGKGQHNAGSSIGTDGNIYGFLIGSMADYLLGDATDAYSTHSPLNNPGVPYPWTDWSWGYGGSNPVEHARRKIVVIRDPANPPYFIVVDEIRKDENVHEYEWRLHTPDDNVIDASSDPVQITGDSGYLNIYALSPSFELLTASTSFFDNGTPDPDAKVLSLSMAAVDGNFSFMLFPGDTGMQPPVVVTSRKPYGSVTGVSWGGGVADVWVMNPSGRPIHTKLDPIELGISTHPGEWDKAGRVESGMSLVADSKILFIRFSNGVVDQYLATEASSFTLDGTQHISITDGKTNVAMAGRVIDIDRPDADFAFYAPAVTDVYCRSQRIDAVQQNGYLVRESATGVGDIPPAGSRLAVRAFPNPFNPVTEISISLETRSHVTAEIYDAMGRLVRRLLNGELEPGTNMLRWDGTNDNGQSVSTGVYLLKVGTGKAVSTLKLTVVK